MNRNAVNCLAVIGSRELKNESVIPLDGRSYSRGVLRETFSKRENCEIDKWEKLNMNLAYSKIMLQRRRFSTFVDAVSRSYSQHILFFMQSRRISSTESNQKVAVYSLVPNRRPPPR